MNHKYNFKVVVEYAFYLEAPYIICIQRSCLVLEFWLTVGGLWVARRVGRAACDTSSLMFMSFLLVVQ